MIIRWTVALVIGMTLQSCTAAPTSSKSTLCDLQRNSTEGELRSVQVEGLYSDGFEMGVLTNPACSSQQTWVELDLRSTANKEILRSMLNSKGQANVVFEGEFFGPARPDQDLPEAIRKSYHPGWGHLGAFKTKLIVHVIRSVSPVEIPKKRVNPGRRP